MYSHSGVTGDIEHKVAMLPEANLLVWLRMVDPLVKIE
jgi:hypothetical protein